VHPRVVMELLGHSQMRTTTDVYSTSCRHWRGKQLSRWGLRSGVVEVDT
jgi:hypothetical protein